MPNKSRTILRDGRSWTFTPGPSGSTVSNSKIKMTGFPDFNVPRRAKAVPSPLVQKAIARKKESVSPAIKRARKNLGPSIIASTRG